MNILTQIKNRVLSLPPGLIGMLVLITLVEGFVARNHLRFGTSTSEEWRAAARAGRRDAAKAEILCVGDSLVKVGVAPPVLERELGLPAYNLALSGGQTPAAYFMLKRAYESGARPKAIFLDCKWSALAHEYQFNARLLPELIGPRECLDLAVTAVDPRFFATLLSLEFLPSLRSRFEIRNNVINAIQGKETSLRFEVNRNLRNWRVNQGAHIVPKEVNYRGEPNCQDTCVYTQHWKPDPVNVVYLERILNLAAENHAQVFLLAMPLTPKTQEHREHNGADRAYSAFLLSVANQHPEVVVLDARFSQFNASVFLDPTHLDRDGASLFSTQIAHLAKPYLSPERIKPAANWINLPNFDRAKRALVNLEDLSESARVLQKSTEATLRR